MALVDRVRKAATATVLLLIFAGTIFQVHHYVVRGYWLWEDPNSATTGWRKRDLPILFLHLHKSGGTTMCQLAKANGERLLASSKNCNLLDDGPAVNAGRVLARFESCQERADYLQSRGASYNAVEHFLDGTHLDALCTDRMRYVTVIRDPLDRIRSVASYHETNSSMMVRYATKDNPEYFKHLIQLDNYYVRTLGGQDTMSLPRGAIKMVHLKRAMRVLASFNDVVLLDDAEGRARLFDSLDWKVFSPVLKSNPSSQSNRIQFRLEDEDAALLARLNHWDVELFRFAKQLVANEAASKSLLSVGKKAESEK